MRTKNAAPISRAESEHLAKVKMSGCALCPAGPEVEAHHVEQGDHFTTIGVCWSCHRGPKGIHGDGTMMRLAVKAVGFRGELLALNITLKRIYG